MKTHPLPVYMQRFFTERLTTQLAASANTIASYRDTFRLLLNYTSERLGREPTALHVPDINADLVGDFLSFIEAKRSNSARTRNTRLAAIRSFFKHVASQEPQLLHHCQRILVMPSKRHEKRSIDYMQRDEIEALIAAPDPDTWTGRRDHTLLMLALQTGLRVSELISLNCGDISLSTGAHVRCIGKGRKERCTPLRKDCIQALRTWLAGRDTTSDSPLFPSNRGSRLSRDAVGYLVAKHAEKAASQCATLKGKCITPHVLRHTAAMELLQNGVDRTVIALWLGHESVETTQMYIHADIKLKERAMERTQPVEIKPGRYRPTDELRAFLEAL